MKILEYPKAEALRPTDVFLLDGPDGTRGITAEKLAEAIGAVGDGAGLVSNINLGVLAETNLLKKGDALLVSIRGGDNRSYILKEDLFWNLLEVSSYGGGFDDILHRNYYRHKNLGNVYTDAQKEAIRTATYHDLFIGDYWEIGDIQWRIVDTNYFTNMGETAVNYPHVVVMPDKHLAADSMYATNSNASGYGGSKVAVTTLPNIWPIITGAFGEGYQGSFDSLVSTACNNGNVSSHSFARIKIKLPSVAQLTGVSPVYESAQLPNSTDWEQFALFKSHPYDAFRRVTYMWTCDIYGTEYFYAMGAYGNIFTKKAGEPAGILPFFLLTGG